MMDLNDWRPTLVSWHGAGVILRRPALAGARVQFRVVDDITERDLEDGFACESPQVLIPDADGNVLDMVPDDDPLGLFAGEHQADGAEDEQADDLEGEIHGGSSGEEADSEHESQGPHRRRGGPGSRPHREWVDYDWARPDVAATARDNGKRPPKVTVVDLLKICLCILTPLKL